MGVASRGPRYTYGRSPAPGAVLWIVGLEKRPVAASLQCILESTRPVAGRLRSHLEEAQFASEASSQQGPRGGSHLCALRFLRMPSRMAPTCS